MQAAFTDLVRAERLKHRSKVLMHYLTDTNLNWQLIADKESKLKKLSDLSDKIVAMTRYSGTDLLTDMVVKKAKPKYQVFRVQVMMFWSDWPCCRIMRLMLIGLLNHK